MLFRKLALIEINAQREKLMNIREGIRRAALVFGGFLAAATLIGVIAATPSEPNEAVWEDKIKSSIQMDFDPSGKFEILWDQPKHGTELIQESCTSPAQPNLKKTCAEYQSAKDGMWLEQSKHIGIALLAGLGVFVCVFLLWRLLDWILAGFGRQTETALK